MPYASKYQRKPRTNAFHIRIGNNMDKIDLKDPAFLKLLEQQYATKYLESLGVQSTSKNIFKILKQYPIQNCQILQSRLNGGLYTDTITIIPKKYNQGNQNENNQKQQVSNEMLTMLDLKRMGEKKYQSQKSNANGNPNSMNAGNNDFPIDDSIIGLNNQQSSLNPNQTGKKSTNSSNFRVKNTGARTNSNAFILQKSQNKNLSSSNPNSINQKSATNLYEDIGFSKLKSNKTSELQLQEPLEGLKFLSFNIEDIKLRYIFPFNDNFKRKSNYKLIDNSNLLEPQDPKIVYEWKVFHFPFTQVKLSLKTLKQLQNPIQAKMTDIQQFLDSFYQQFPSQAFPLAPEIPKQSATSLTQTNLNKTLEPQININSNQKNNQNSQINQVSQSLKHNKTSQSMGSDKITPTTMIFTKQQIDSMFSILRSQSMCKMIGVFLHLSYWCIFGGVNPIQIESTMKKKMYIMMFETIQYFQIKIDNKKLWSTLVFPMILLLLKMSSHYFFSKQYVKIFQSQQAQKLQIDQLALDKIMYLVQKMFDQSNINGRFIFLESQITGAKGTFLKDKQFIRKRIFGTSPALQIMLPNPKNGKARAIMAKNMDRQKNNFSDNMFGKLSQIKMAKDDNQTQSKQCQQKLLSLALHKINNRLQQIQGHSSQINPIINLKV